ncbi:MAG: hypothetical protein AB4290_23715 [Spirulina sp.]
MKTLVFAFTGVVAFLLIAQLLHASHYVSHSRFNPDSTEAEINYTPPNRDFPATTLPSGTR